MAICLRGFPGEVVTFKVDKDSHWIVMVVNLEGLFAILINIYGYKSNVQNRILLGIRTEIIADYKKMYGIRFTLIGEDFNMAPDDRWPSIHTNHHSNIALK